MGIERFVRWVSLIVASVAGLELASMASICGLPFGKWRWRVSEGKRRVDLRRQDYVDSIL